jgi:RING-type zinc-finger
MGRQSSIKPPANQATGLLNFHFATPTTQPDSRGGNHSNRNSSNNNYDNRRSNDNNNRGGSNKNNVKQNKNKQRSAVDRASARRKANASMFYLHSSASHAFILTRHAPGNAMVNQQKQGYSFSGCDEPVAWDSVRMVKQLVAATSTSASTSGTHHHGSGSVEATTLECPICLDALVCPRISKCGHTFCLACILRHVQTAHSINPYQAIKCPCCALPVIVGEMRPVLVESYRPPMLHQRTKLIKLHRTKECGAPYLPLPEQPKHSNPHTAPCMTDPDAKYCRFNYIDPFLYQAHLANNQTELEREMASIRTMMGPSSVELTFLTMALEIVLKENLNAQFELEEEQILMDRFASPSAGMYQLQSPTLIAKNSYEEEEEHEEWDRPPTWNESATLSPLSAKRSGEGDELEPTLPTPNRRYRGDSISSHHSVESHSSRTSNPLLGCAPISPNSNRRRRLSNRRVLPSSMYLDVDAVQLYQAEDGQLVFLNGFNVACLASDASKNLPTGPTGSSEAVADASCSNELGTTPTKSEDVSFSIPVLPPLPDFVEGTVLELETVQITQDVRKRMPFLAHIPLCTEVIFVELDLNDLLSNATKHKFKVELAKRKKRRQSKVQAEKRVDREIKKKEEETIQHRKLRMQRIDPDDEFFHVIPPELIEPTVLVGEEFGPSISTRLKSQRQGAEHDPSLIVRQPTVPVVSFSVACRRRAGGDPVLAQDAFPALGSSSHEAFPALGAPSMERKKPTASWGKTGTGGNHHKAADPILSNTATLQTALPPVGKKKRGGKKLVLFSTGAQRGSGF